MSQSDNLQKEIDFHVRRLQKLREKKAQLGIASDPSIDIEIEDIETQIDGLQVKLEESLGGETTDVIESITNFKGIRTGKISIGGCTIDGIVVALSLFLLIMGGLVTYNYTMLIPARETAIALDATGTPTITPTQTFVPLDDTPEAITITPKPTISHTDFIVLEQKMWNFLESGGCSNETQIYVAVFDSSNNPLDGIVVGDTLGNSEVVSGTKGPGRAEVTLWYKSLSLIVKRNLDGTNYTSEETIPFPVYDEDIPNDWLINAEYCDSPEDCQQRRENNKFCRGHYSYSVIFQRTY